MSESNAKYPMSEAVRAAYQAGEDDEQMEPLTRVDPDGAPVGRFQDGDYVVFYNIRGEREVELSQALVDEEFEPFGRPPIRLQMSTMIQYAPSLPVKVAFPPLGEVDDALVEVVTASGRRVAKVCESEKAIHVAFFLNGKRQEPWPGEERFVAESPTVKDYGTVPELNCRGVGDLADEKLSDGTRDLVIINFANVDVIGHVENEGAILRAVAAVDEQIGRVVAKAIDEGYQVLITADHGTVEKWHYPDGAIDTGHTDSLVPFMLVNAGAGVKMRDGGALTDVAPTILDLLGLPKPQAMTGNSLIEGDATARTGGDRSRVLLVIADGWGHRDEADGNLIAKADTPNMDRLMATWPMTTLEAAGEAVGMPEGSVGNSETGHLHIAAGRKIYADRVRINKAIEDGSFNEIPAWLDVMRGAKRDGTRLHLLGIVSFYSSHGSVDHLKALMRLAQAEQVPEVYIHSMLGRRGERPESGAIYVRSVEEEAERLGVGKLVGVIGRFWSLDREHNWDRIEKTYRWLTESAGRPVREG